jgi:hypothetical protein
MFDRTTSVHSSSAGHPLCVVPAFVKPDRALAAVLHDCEDLLGHPPRFVRAGRVFVGEVRPNVVQQVGGRLLQAPDRDLDQGGSSLQEWFWSEMNGRSTRLAGRR